jgi:hypothetical protein
MRDTGMSPPFEHPLDAGFGHAQAFGHHGIGDAGGLEFGLEQRNQIGGGAHDIGNSRQKVSQTILQVEPNGTSSPPACTE